MIPQHAAEGLVELVHPEGGRVLVDFRDRVARNPEIEADVIRKLLDADEDRDLCTAVSDYAESSGLAARYYLGAEAVIVAIGDP